MNNRYATGGIFLIPKDYQIPFGCRDGCIRVITKGRNQEGLRLVINQEPINQEALRIAVKKVLRKEKRTNDSLQHDNDFK